MYNFLEEIRMKKLEYTDHSLQGVHAKLRSLLSPTFSNYICIIKKLVKNVNQ